MSKDNIFTYVGAGADSPQVINFMSKQRFVRGQATEVTDPEVLRKVVNNPTFVAGSVDAEKVHESDVVASEEVKKKVANNNKINEAAKRATGKWAMAE